jgi:hypothetical protein
VLPRERPLSRRPDLDIPFGVSDDFAGEAAYHSFEPLARRPPAHYIWGVDENPGEEPRSKEGLKSYAPESSGKI